MGGVGAGHKITAVCRVEVSGVQTLRRGEGATPGAQERLWKEVTRGPRPLSTLIPALSCAPKTNKQASKATKVSLSLKMQVWTLSGDLKTGWRHMPRVAPPESLQRPQLTASCKLRVLVGAVPALDDAVTDHGLEEALLAVLTHEVHEASTQGL